ncbi:bifunctional phosphopantothenoylcysteine decarboxylase/phosphopantothenate--cysteine ligase CoaBC [Aquimarina pacifica]|uniref:bifunctional phosphopantothenoylcysteine decarboxylase/phosphopantothenate--cysteine ligase CoaBC n=1 Tax=Aquimarina pacifica TaxID=1296415 RepID=UPI00046F5789|nr:bifunctional phosphopantothenoylcysteine decarboxylase/phosphopantothenate--cysteine ligase CoaBC [Aquimarina pacifica]
MSILSGKKILLGVTAGIAAYKVAELVRLFIKSGSEVQVIMTPAAKDFVTPLTLSTLSKRPVYSSFFDEEDENAVWNNHVDLGLWADVMLIAPATANTLSKMATGNSDNLLLATYLSAKCPVYFAPAMDLDMYNHPSTHKTFETLIKFGNTIIPAESGELASGLVGKGRMAEPKNILQFIENDILNGLFLKNKKVLITAGPTYEAIDPVRFIGNHSSGRMGVALAKVAADLGAQVFLILGPSAIQVNHSNITVINVISAQDMFEAVKPLYPTCDIAIAAAAVADYRPKTISNQKIKKKDTNFSIDLERTTDILKWMGAEKKHQFLVGFALETENEEANAKNKLKNKNLDLIVLNSLNDKGAGFKGQTNKVSLINHKLDIKTFELKTKSEVAQDIFNEINILKNE